MNSISIELIASVDVLMEANSLAICLCSSGMCSFTFCGRSSIYGDLGRGVVECIQNNRPVSELFTRSTSD